jgi:hypothetical protein
MGGRGSKLHAARQKQPHPTGHSSWIRQGGTALTTALRPRPGSTFRSRACFLRHQVRGQMRTPLLLGLAALLCAACSAKRPAAPPPRASAAPVALAVEGPAFARPGVTEQVRAALEARAGRPVVLVHPAGASTQRRAMGLAGRLARQNPALASYEWDEPRCRAEAAALGAVEGDVVGVYRVSLDDRLAGSVALTSFGRAPSPAPARLARPGRAALADAGARVAAAAGALVLPAEPDWRAYAARSVAGGCPFLALLVSETRIPAGAARRQLEANAMAAMERRVAKPEAAAAPQPTAEPNEDERYSCSALCRMHMVELCNNDKMLWSYHRLEWEPTPCGTRRAEPFLAECYRQQWFNGTFYDSCVLPCQGAADGRETLLQVLDDEGCLPTP